MVPDSEVAHGERVLICSGKIGHELRAERRRRKDQSTAILFLDQLYPFPEEDLATELAKHSGEIVWVQEEPANMGAFTYVMPELRRMAGDRTVLSVKRSPNASPATGSAKAHQIEESTLIDLALGSAL